MVELDISLPEGYKPSEGEINNFVYLVCKYTVGWMMRGADLAVCQMMTGPIVGKQGLEKLLEQTTEYVWDHICGEPEEPTAEQLALHMKPVLEEWYSKSTPEERAVTQ